MNVLQIQNHIFLHIFLEFNYLLIIKYFMILNLDELCYFNVDVLILIILQLYILRLILIIVFFLVSEIDNDKYHPYYNIP
jgi:hypothetical protein